jgi:hypothetical protein
MRYLKKYKVFESKEEIDDTISVLKDLILDIKDKDLNVKIYTFNKKRYTNQEFEYEDTTCIEIIISKNEDDMADSGLRPYGRFNLSNIKNEIIQIVEFMDSQGWKIGSSEVVDVTGPQGVLNILEKK